MDTKLRLKQMSHKQLRKLVKRLGKEVTELNTSLNSVRNRVTNLIADRDTLNTAKNNLFKHNEELKRDYKRQYECNDRYVEELEGHKKHIADLEHALVELNKQTASKIGYGYPGIGKSTFIGEMPDTLNMGVDGQIKTVEERYAAVEQSEIAETEEHAAWVASEVARVQQENFDNRIVTPVSQEEINKTVDNAAVEWAERNGHHFPNGRPDKDRSTSVHIKSADEISADNAARHEEMKP